MSLQLGETAPDFTAETTRGRIHFHEWLGSSWGLFVSHPRDFTPVCTTELGRLALLQSHFDERGVKIMGLSIDNVVSHEQWLHDIRDTHGVNLQFPIIADVDRSIAHLYGMLHPKHDEAFAVRSVFVIDPAKKVRLTLAYPRSCGRNFAEILRTIDSLQFTDSHDIVTPADWRVGDDVIIPPAVSDEEAHSKFPRGWREIKPYLRVTPDPRI